MFLSVHTQIGLLANQPMEVEMKIVCLSQTTEVIINGIMSIVINLTIENLCVKCLESILEKLSQEDLIHLLFMLINKNHCNF